MGEEINIPDAASAAFARARELEASGDDRAATSAYLVAFTLAPDAAPYRRAALARLNVMTGYRSLPAPLLEALSRVAEGGTGDLQPLAMVARTLAVSETRLRPLCECLTQGDGLAVESALADAAWLLDDAIVLAVLCHAINVSLPLEAVVVALRRHLCLAVAGGRETLLLTRYARFAAALAAQAITNGYLWPVTPAEIQALEKLPSRARSDILMVRAAYRPLTEIGAGEADGLPEPLRQLWHDEADEHRRRARLPHLTALAPGLSRAMQAQYEAYPYPRWRQTEIGARTSLRALLRPMLPEALADRVPTGPYDILVAGCGTGRPALDIALGLTDAQVLAVDLSRTSLAYAERMATRLGAKNISFAIADILNLGGLEKRFDLIECSGVLHHMAEPGEELAALRRLIKDDGVMLVSLYSARGRTAETAARAFISGHGYPDTLDGLREARAALISLPQDDPAHAVTESVEFFSRDGLHDLVFNIHESCTSPAAMKQLLQAHGLTPIAIDAPAVLGAGEFRRIHPNPADWRDLDRWDAFERQRPDIFAHMIKVWCVPA